MSRVRLCDPALPPHLHDYVLVDQRGLPRYWSTVWQALSDGALSDGTIASRLSAIERLYVHAEDQGISLDRLLATADASSLGEIVTGFFVALSNESTLTGQSNRKTWEGAIGFVLLLMRKLCPAGGQIGRLERTAAEKNLFMAAQQPSKRKAKTARIRALPASVVREIEALVLPGSNRNPFRCAAEQWRNYVIVLLMLYGGLRRGEVLLLTPQSIHDAVDRHGRRKYWVTVDTCHDALDDRKELPGIKTPSSKRQIPIDGDIVAIIDRYVAEHRGSVDHPFLINSNRKRPLALRAVTHVFAAISKEMDEAVRSDLRAKCNMASVSAHDLRHTCAVARLSILREKEEDEQKAISSLRKYFGWSANSVMPSHYAEAYFEDRLGDHFGSAFDSRLEQHRHLRLIERNANLIRGRLPQGGAQ